jgi:hydrogenase nickel incorporation protein HypA/HybF
MQRACARRRGVRESIDVHEISVVQSLIDEVAVAAGTGSGGEPWRVTAVRVRVGVMSGVVPEALRFAFDAAAPGTVLAGARLRIESVNLAVWCDACGTEREPASTQRLRCPACGARTPRVVRGRELELASIEVVDAAVSGAAAATDPAGAAAGPEEE